MALIEIDQLVMATPPWVDCFKLLPYRDYTGTWRWPHCTQRRTVDGIVQYREREETYEEWGDRL